MSVQVRLAAAIVALGLGVAAAVVVALLVRSIVG
jgi:hypothetical protein